MEHTPLVCAVTLNWNRCDDTLACLRSMVAQAPAPPQLLVVVDNGSTDGSVEAIARSFPQVELIANERNLGFAAGFNRGLRRALEAGADYALVVNNDTTLAPDLVARLVEAAAAPGVGVAGPVIYYASRPEAVWAAGAGRSRWTLELTGDHGRGEQMNRVTEREFLSGCAWMIRREVLERVGLLDERFFVYYEDSDYCLRIRQAGYRLVVEPRARMWHKVSASSQGSDSPAERYWMGRSSVLFFRKHIRGWRWPLVLAWRMGGTLKTIVRLVSAGRSAAALAYLRGEWDGLRASSSPLTPFDFAQGKSFPSLPPGEGRR